MPGNSPRSRRDDWCLVWGQHKLAPTQVWEMLLLQPISLLLSPPTVFICSFMVAAPIFGYLGDRFNRKIILSCGIFFWSAITFSSSFITEQVRSCVKEAVVALQLILGCVDQLSITALLLSFHVEVLLA